MIWLGRAASPAHAGRVGTPGVLLSTVRLTLWTDLAFRIRWPWPQIPKVAEEGKLTIVESVCS